MSEPTALQPSRRRLLRAAAASALVLTTPTLARADALAPNPFRFDAWPGPALDVFLHRPKTAGPGAPLLFVMHGVARGGRGYRDAWITTADAHGLIIAAPTFPKAAFPGARGYQIGVSATAETSSHAVIEPLFDALRADLGLTAEHYWMYGHSAGSQFTHRFLFRTGGPRCAGAVCANAGWYMAPDPAAPFPYGLDGAGDAAASMNAALAKPLTVLLGDADTRRDGSLRQTPGAEAQGPHRLARGRAFFETAETLATDRAALFNWRLATAPGVGHSNKKMAPFAAEALRRLGA